MTKHSERDNVHGGTDAQKARIEGLNRKVGRFEKIVKSSGKADTTQGNGKKR